MSSFGLHKYRNKTGTMLKRDIASECTIPQKQEASPWTKSWKGKLGEERRRESFPFKSVLFVFCLSIGLGSTGPFSFTPSAWTDSVTSFC